MKFILIILDGLGLRDEIESNAVKLANTPFLDQLFDNYPMAKLETSGSAVGLPDGVMGNSEVGHLTIGAGRIIKHDLVRINHSLQTNRFRTIPEFVDIVRRIKAGNGNLHLIGLLSDGGVHSHINHLFSILEILKIEGITNVFIHAITDGRDTSPTSGVGFVKDAIEKMNEIGVGKLSTIIGRYYAMDRDNRWERTALAYNAFVHGEGVETAEPLQQIKTSYETNITDEFIKPIIVKDSSGSIHHIKENDAIFMLNFRADRMRQVTRAFGVDDFTEFQRNGNPSHVSTMSKYDDGFPFPFLFPPVTLLNIFPEVLDREGYRQLRIAETEKYAHVTYFFNGGEETPFHNEERILVASPKVPTYNLQPEMSAIEITDKMLKSMNSGKYDCIIMNFANPDMVGHTGDLDAAMTAIETIDGLIKKIIETAARLHYTAFLTSDHGNLEMMTDPKSSEEHTAHTLNQVPFLMISSDNRYSLYHEGSLSDIAPTILNYLRIPVPEEMTGKSLLRSE